MLDYILYFILYIYFFILYFYIYITIEAQRGCLAWKKKSFVITSDKAIRLDGFTSLQTRGIQAYWHEKSPTEENSDVLMGRRGVFFEERKT